MKVRRTVGAGCGMGGCMGKVSLHMRITAEARIARSTLTHSFTPITFFPPTTFLLLLLPPLFPVAQSSPPSSLASLANSYLRSPWSLRSLDYREIFKGRHQLATLLAALSPDEPRTLTAKAMYSQLEKGGEYRKKLKVCY